MSRLLQLRQSRFDSGVGFAGQDHRHEDPVLAVDLGRAQRLAGHGQDSLPFLAGALGDQLFRPEAEARDARARARR